MGNVKAGRLNDPETGESLSDVETTLGGLGIKLRSSNQEFRNFGEVLNEVAGKWSSFSSVQQRAIAVAFGGTRQQEKMLILLQNMNNALALSEVSANSAGTAVAKYNSAYSNSVEAAQNRMTANFEQFSTTVLNSELISGVFDGTAGFLGWLTSVTKAFGSFPSLLAAAGAALSAFMNKGAVSLTKNENGKGMIFGRDISIFGHKLGSNGTVISKSVAKEYNKQLDLLANNSKLSASLSDSEKSAWAFNNALTKLGKTQNDVNNITKETCLNSKGAAIDLKKVGTSAVATSIGVKALNVALNIAKIALNTLISFGIGILLDVLISGIDNLIHKNEKLIEAGQEATQTITGLRDEINSLTASQKALLDSYDKLSAGVDSFGNNLALTEDEYADYHDTVNQLVSLFPDLLSYYDEEGNAIIKTGVKVDTLTEKYKELIRQKQFEAASQFGAQLDGFKAKYADQNGSDSYQYKRNEYQNFINATQSPEEFLKAVNSGGNLQNEIITILLNNGLDFSNDLLTLTSGTQFNNEKWISFWNELKFVRNNIIAQSNQLESGFKGEEAQLRNTAQIVAQITSGYDDLSDSSKAYLASIIGSINFDFTQDGAEEKLNALVRNLIGAFNNPEYATQISSAVGTWFKTDELYNAGQIGAEQYIEGMRNALYGIVDVLADSGASQEIIDAVVNMWDGILGGNNGLDKIVGQQIDAIKKQMPSIDKGWLAGLSEKDLTRVFHFVVDTTHTGNIGMQDVKNFLDDTNVDETVSSYQNKIDAFNKVATEMRASGKVSTETMKEFVAVDKDAAVNFIRTTDGWKVGATELQNLAKKYSDAAVQELVLNGATEQTIAKFVAMNGYLFAVADKTTNLSTELKTLDSNMNVLSKAVQEQNKSGEISISTMYDIMDATEDWASLIDIQNGKIHLNTEAVQENAKVHAEAVVQKVRNTKIEAIAVVTGLQSELLAMQNVSAMISGSGADAAWLAKEFGGGEAVEKLQNSNIDFSKLDLQLKQALALANAIDTNGIGSYNKEKGTGSGSGSDTYAKAFEAQLEKLKHDRSMNLIDEKTYLDALDALNKKYFGNYESFGAKKEEYEKKYWQYDEEVFSGRIQLYQTDLTSFTNAQDAKIKAIETEMAMLSPLSDRYKELAQDRIRSYTDKRDSQHSAADQYRIWGFAESSAEIQGFQSAWVDNDQKLKDVLIQDTKDISDALKERNSLQITLLEQELKQYGSSTEEYKALSDKKRALLVEEMQSYHAIAEAYRAAGYANDSSEIVSAQQSYKSLENEIISYNEDVLDTIYNDKQSALNRSIELLDKEKAYYGSDSEEYKNLVDERLDYMVNQQQLAFERIQTLRKTCGDESEVVQDAIDEWREYRDKIGEYAAEAYEAVIASRDRMLTKLESDRKWLNSATDSKDLATFKDSIDESMSVVNDKLAETSALIQKYLAAGYAEESEKIQTLRAELVSFTNDRISLAKEAYDAEIEFAQNQKDAINDVVDKVKELIKQEKENEKDNLQKQINDYKEIIDLRKKELDAIKDKYKFEKEIEEASKDIAKMQERVTLLALDDSREATAERLELEDKLNDAKDKLNDKQHDKYIEMQGDAYDADSDKFEDSMNQKIKAIDDFVNNAGWLAQEAYRRIEQDGENTYQQLLSWNDQYGTAVSTDISTAWNKAQSAFKEYADVVGNFSVSGILDNINTSINTTFTPPANVAAGTVSNATNNTLNKMVVSDLVNQMRSNSLQWNASANKDQLQSNNKAIVEQIKKFFSDIGEKHDISFDSHTGKWYIDGKELYSVYHEGGVVGGSELTSQQRLFKMLQSDEVPSILRKGEMVLTEQHQSNLKNLIASAFTFSGTQNSVPNITVENNITIPEASPDVAKSFKESVNVITNNIIDTINGALNKRGIRYVSGKGALTAN